MGQKYRPNYWKNAALLTGSDVVLRLAGLGLRIGLANALGGEGMGLYQLVLAVYGLFVTLATAGISVAATRLLTEELSRDAASARGMLRRLLALGAGLGVLAMAAQAGLAGLAAKWWLGDVRAAGALRLSALGLPWMAVSAVLRGFFLARRRVGLNVASQLAEQTVRIGAVAAALYATPGRDAGERCTLVLGATALSEAVSCTLMALFCRGEARRCFGGKRAQTPPEASRRLWDILWPVEGGRVLASALHTAENMLVPACLAVYLTGAGGRAAALERYGVLKGMALPLLTFPFGLLGSLADSLLGGWTTAAGACSCGAGGVGIAGAVLTAGGTGWPCWAGLPCGRVAGVLAEGALVARVFASPCGAGGCVFHTESPSHKTPASRQKATTSRVRRGRAGKRVRG